jgi:hypothetical protein
MRKLFGILAIAAFFVATTANAAPVLRTVNATMSVAIQGLDAIGITGTGTVTVDTVTGTIVIPAGLVNLTAKVVVPVTASSAITSLSAKVISNQAGTLSVGGATGQLPGEVCPAGLPACVAGGGVGGKMGLTGGINVVIVPMVVVIPVDLNDALVGQGGSTNIPFSIDAAAWTTGVGIVTTPNGTVPITGTGSIGGSMVTFVTPTFVSALGNLLPLFTTLKLDFGAVPEPGTLLLLGAGVAGLIVVGRRRS